MVKNNPVLIESDSSRGGVYCYVISEVAMPLFLEAIPEDVKDLSQKEERPFLPGAQIMPEVAHKVECLSVSSSGVVALGRPDGIITLFDIRTHL